MVLRRLGCDSFGVEKEISHYKGLRVNTNDYFKYKTNQHNASKSEDA